MPETAAISRPRLDPRWGLVVLAACSWGLLGVFATELADEGLGARDIGLWRAIVGGVCFAVHATVARQLRGVVGLGFAPLVAFAAVAVAGFFISLPAAIETGGVSLAFVLLYTAPAIVALAAPFVLKEPSSRATVALVAVTLLGIVLVAVPDSTGVTVTTTSVLWGLASGVGYASYYLAGKLLTRTVTPAGLYAVVFPIGAIMLVPVADLSLPSARAAWLAVGIGVVSTYVPFLAYTSALRVLPAARVALVATLEPVVALVIAAAVYEERLHPIALAGSGLILIAAAAASRNDASSASN